MSNTFTNAWVWSLRHSPLMAMWRSLRGTIQPNKDAFALLEEAALPKSVDGVIRTTITRTKLWRNERAQVARELIAHAQDALDAGRDPDQITSTFGDPRRVARLLRRSMKRKRPFSWQAYRFSRRVAAALFLIVFAGYLTLAVRFYSGSPSIETDYFAVLSAQENAYAPEQRSWPVIAEVGHLWDRESSRLRNTHASLNSFLAARPGDEGYEDLAETVRGMEQDLQRVREAAKRPIIGAPKGYELEQVHEEGVSWTVGIVPADKEAYRDHTLIGALLPQLSWTRRLSILLAFDARLAREEGDTDRVVQNLIAIAHLARQCSREPYLISSLVSMAIDGMFATEVAMIMREDPYLFSTSQLAELAHANAMTEEADLNLETERMLFDDILQRAYTDDGSGGGRLAPEGAELLAGLQGIYWRDANQTNSGYQVMESVAMPTMLLLMNDRAEERAIYDSILDRNKLVLSQGPRAIGWMSYDQQLLDWRAEQRLPVLSPAEMVAPAMGSAVQQVFLHRMREQAAAAMFAIEVFRNEHARLPDSLNELPPSLLPQQPQDAFDPGNTIRYIRGDKGGYVLYSVGADGDDDRASPPTEYVDKVNDLMMRYPFTITQDDSGKPLVERDASGQPRLASPLGPDGDWILIDTRPESDDPQAP
ncbi:MAG: hypothetical protein ACF8LL_06810 [Phycisphaerales bacterium]